VAGGRTYKKRKRKYRKEKSGLGETKRTWVFQPEQCVILQIVSDARQVHDDRYIQGRQYIRVADSRELEDLRSVNCAGGNDDFPTCVYNTTAEQLPQELFQHGRHTGYQG
jgi:hypothetical protein